MDALQKLWASIVRFFRIDQGVKFVSLLLAILLWAFVVTSNTYVYQMDIPLRIVNIQEGKTLAEEVPGSVTAQFRGSGITYIKTILTKPYSEMSLRVDARRITNFYDYNLQEYLNEHPDNLILPRGLNLEIIDIVHPEVVHLELDDVQRKTLRIISGIQVTPVSGYTMVDRIQIEPDSLTLQGPSEKIAEIDTVKTEQVNVENADDLVTGTADIIFPWSSLVTSSVEQVQYEADIQPISERQIRDIPVRVRNVPDRLDVTTAPSSVSLIVEGGANYIYNLETSEIEVYIDYNADWNPNQHYYVPHVEVPSDVLEWRNLQPKRVEIIVVRKQ